VTLADQRLDELAKALGDGRHSRRQVFKISAGLAGALFASAWPTRGFGARGGNSACAHFCNGLLPPGRARGKCKSDAAHGEGLCFECGPAAPPGHPPPCGEGCCAPGELCCKGECIACDEGETLNPATCRCEGPGGVDICSPGDAQCTCPGPSPGFAGTICCKTQCITPGLQHSCPGDRILDENCMCVCKPGTVGCNGACSPTQIGACQEDSDCCSGMCGPAGVCCEPFPVICPGRDTPFEPAVCA
jgi:hypothetical protein